MLYASTHHNSELSDEFFTPDPRLVKLVKGSQNIPCSDEPDKVISAINLFIDLLWKQHRNNYRRFGDSFQTNPALLNLIYNYQEARAANNKIAKSENKKPKSWKELMDFCKPEMHEVKLFNDYIAFRNKKNQLKAVRFDAQGE